MVIFFHGFGMGAALIIAIGAQNSFVLGYGIRRQSLYLIPFICSLCDIILILAGAAGLGATIASSPLLRYGAGIGGAVFLAWYGLKALHSCLFTDATLESEHLKKPPGSVIAATLAVSLLNPHVYLDTVVMLGSISSQYSSFARILFCLGACCASVCWFYSLSLGGSLLQPIFRKKVAWKAFDIFICMIMWTTAYAIWPGDEW